MIKGINLIPDELQREWRLRRLRAVITAIAVFYLCALAVVYLNQRSTLTRKIGEANAAALERDRLIAASSQYAELSRRFSGIRQTETDLKKRLDVVANLSDKRLLWAVFLKKLSHTLPKNVWLKSLSTSDTDAANGKKKIRFQGSATSNGSIAEFLYTLENSGYAQDVSLQYSQKKDFNAATVYDFEISMTLKKMEDIAYER